MDYRDGDVFELKLTDSHGVVIVERRYEVAYARRQVCCQTCGTAIVDGGT
jgi:hypothetical protein